MPPPNRLARSPACRAGNPIGGMPAGIAPTTGTPRSARSRATLECDRYQDRGKVGRQSPVDSPDDQHDSDRRQPDEQRRHVSFRRSADRLSELGQRVILGNQADASRLSTWLTIMTMADPATSPVSSNLDKYRLMKPRRARPPRISTTPVTSPSPAARDAKRIGRRRPRPDDRDRQQGDRRLGPTLISRTPPRSASPMIAPRDAYDPTTDRARLAGRRRAPAGPGVPRRSGRPQVARPPRSLVGADLPHERDRVQATGDGHATEYLLRGPGGA